MALIQCPECGQQISDTAEACPHCGAPVGGIQCPKCGSRRIQFAQKGFGVGKAAAGAILLGPVGILAGGLGSKKLKKICIDCGYKF